MYTLLVGLIGSDPDLMALVAVEEISERLNEIAENDETILLMPNLYTLVRELDADQFYTVTIGYLESPTSTRSVRLAQKDYSQ